MPRIGKSMLNTSNQYNNNYSKQLKFDGNVKFLLKNQPVIINKHNSLITYLDSTINENGLFTDVSGTEIKERLINN